MLEGREHLALFFAIDQVVVVLHRDERSEIVGDSVVWVQCQYWIRIRVAGIERAHFASGGLREVDGKTLYI